MHQIIWQTRKVCFDFVHRDVGVKAIENLMEKRGKFDYILLETTGLADPGKYDAFRDWSKILLLFRGNLYQQIHFLCQIK